MDPNQLVPLNQSRWSLLPIQTRPRIPSWSLNCTTLNPVGLEDLFITRHSASGETAKYASCSFNVSMLYLLHQILHCFWEKPNIFSQLSFLHSTNQDNVNSHGLLTDVVAANYKWKQTGCITYLSAISQFQCQCFQLISTFSVMQRDHLHMDARLGRLSEQKMYRF